MPAPTIRDGVFSFASLQNQTSLSVAVARGAPEPGDLRLAIFATNANANPQPPSGWVLLARFTPGSGFVVHVMGRVCQQGDPDEAIAYSASSATTAIIIAVAGHSLTAASDAASAATGSASSSTSLTAPTRTAPIGRQSLLVTAHFSFGAASGNNSYTLSTPAGMGRVAFATSDTGYPGLVCAQAVEPGATGTRTSIGSTAYPWRAMALAVPGTPDPVSGAGFMPFFGGGYI